MVSSWLRRSKGVTRRWRADRAGGGVSAPRGLSPALPLLLGAQLLGDPRTSPHPSHLGRTPREPGRSPRAQTRSPSADPGSSLEIFGAIRRGIDLGASGDLSTSGFCLEGRVRRGSRHWWTSHQKHPLTCLARFVQLLSTRPRSCPWWIESLEWEVCRCSRDPPLRWEAAGRVSGPLKHLVLKGLPRVTRHWRFGRKSLGSLYLKAPKFRHPRLYSVIFKTRPSLAGHRALH
jgi:hypothetical protein